MSDDWVRVSFGATATRNNADLDLVRKQLHDQVIADLGEARTGPVSWRWLSAPDGIDLLLEQGYGSDPKYAGLLTFLASNRDGWLVLATAPAKREVPA